MRDDYGHAGTLRRLDAGRGILDRHGLVRAQSQSFKRQPIDLRIGLLSRRLVGADDCCEVILPVAAEMPPEQSLDIAAARGGDDPHRQVSAAALRQQFRDTGAQG